MRVAHLTTIDLSLRYLVFPQLLAVRASGGEAIGISAPGPFVDDLEAAGVRHIALPGSTRGMDLFGDLRAAWSLWRILRRERVDVLHTHNPKPGVYGRIIGRLAGVPHVVNTVHGLFATESDHCAKRCIVYGLEVLSARFSDAELIQNPEDLELLRNLPLYPRSRARLLGNGVDLKRFEPSRFSDEERLRVRNELGISPGQIAVGAVGRLVVEKGYLELFRAAEQLGPEYVVFAIGPDDPEKADAITPAAVERARRNGVRFLGMRTDVESVYAGLDIFVLPSYREGYPRVAMEAAAMGLPVVATDVRGCRQVVEDGLTGMLIPPRDSDALAAAIKALGTNETLRLRMGAAARIRAERLFDEQQIVDIVLETYQSLVRPEQTPNEAVPAQASEDPWLKS